MSRRKTSLLGRHGRLNPLAISGCTAVAAWLCLAPGPVALAHPVPDVPLRSFFDADGSAVIEIELDTRCFSDDPESEPYLLVEQ